MNHPAVPCNLAEVSSPMILTGYAALNKLLGKNVYSSQAQRGGWRFGYASIVTINNGQ